MYYSKLAKSSTHSGPGIRCTLYVSGCRNNCPGCQNPEARSFTAGNLYTRDIEDSIIAQVSKDHIAGLTLCGGEPMEPENQEALLNLIRRVKSETGKDIWCYTGYEFEDLMPGGKKHCEITSCLLYNIDVLIVGKYIESQRDITSNNLWRGSRNQRILNLPESLMAGKPIMLTGVLNNQ